MRWRGSALAPTGGSRAIDNRDECIKALAFFGLNHAVARQVMDVIQSVERDASSEFSLSWTLEDVLQHSSASASAVGHLRTAFTRLRRDSQFDSQFPVYQLLQLRAVPTLKLECGQCFVDYNYAGADDAKKVYDAAADVAVCENLFYAPVVTEQVAVEALEYAAALVRHVFVHLYGFIMQQRDDELRLPLLELAGDGDLSHFQILYDTLAVAAGGKLARAIKRMRCGPSLGADERCVQPRPLFLHSRSDNVATGIIPFEGSTLADMTFEFCLKAQQFNIPDEILQQMLEKLQDEDVVVDLSDPAVDWKVTFLYRFGMVGLVRRCARPCHCNSLFRSISNILSSGDAIETQTITSYVNHLVDCVHSCRWRSLHPTAPCGPHATLRDRGAIRTYNAFLSLKGALVGACNDSMWGSSFFLR